MEKKFNDLLKKTKAHEMGETEASKTFEFDLFREENWFLSMNEWDQNLHSSTNVKPVIKENIAVNIAVNIELKNSTKVNPEAKLKVLFIGDTYQAESETEDLLNKMIVAMKLTSNEFVRIPLDPSLEDIDDLENNLINPTEAFKKLLTSIEDQAPIFVISLGATMTNLLLGRREKMSGIHGKFFKLNANKWEFQLMPLFHPDFLLINPNMKRTAWIDLQKVMESLGKI